MNSASNTFRRFRSLGLSSLLALGSLAGCVMDSESGDFDTESAEIDAVSLALGSEVCNGIDDDGDFLIDEDAANTQNGALCNCTESVFAGHEYRTCERELDFDAAKAMCKSRGFDLAQIGDASENSFLEQRLNTNTRIWIGLDDRANEGTWIWSDGSLLLGGYSHWSPGQPDDFGGNQDCVTMYDNSGLWLDMECAAKHRSFCELFDPVTWTNLSGVDVDGTTLIKTSSGVGWDAGASSTQAIPMGSNGFVQFSTNETNTSKAAGLSVGDSNTRLADIDFAIVLKDDGKVAIYESTGPNSTVLKDDLGAYVKGDVFRVEILVGVVRYLRNGALMHSHAVSVTGPLLVDTSLKTQGATIADVRTRTCAAGDTSCIDPGVWQDAKGVLAKGGTVQAYGWTKKASTIATMTGNGYVEFTTPKVEGDTLTHWQKIAGLRDTTVASDNWGFNIKYGVQFGYVGEVPTATARFLGANDWACSGNQGSVMQVEYAAEDEFRVEISGSTVYYKKNDETFCSHAIAPSSNPYVLQVNLPNVDALNVDAPSSFTELSIVDLP